MDSNGAMESNGGIVYETLDSLSFFANHYPDPDPTESYAVFSNEITASTDLSADISVTDYFSLDIISENPRPEAENSTPLPSIDRFNGESNVSELAWFRVGSRFKSPMIQLHKEIIDFCDFVSPTPEEQGSRTAAVQSVFEVVKFIWPHCKVEVFGSFRTGLYLPTSDIDVVILESKVKTPQIGLYALAKALSQRNVAKKMQVIAKARVPIIKFVEKQSRIAFDISFDIDGGPKAADFIKDAVKKIPPLRPLCLILKVFLQQRELNEVYSGGIGSYTLLAMLIAYLQVYWRGQRRCRQFREHNLGTLLMNFFDFYGHKLNTSDVGVSCNSSGTFFLKTEKGFLNAERPHLLAVEDPQAPDNDIGRSSFNYFKVRSAFSLAYSLLSDAKNIIGLGSHKSILGTIIRPDPVLLDRKGGNNGELTLSSLLAGADEPISRRFGNENGDIYNWQSLDEESPLPREKMVGDDACLASSAKSRASKEKRRSRKGDNGEASKSIGGVSRDSVDAKKKRRKAFKANDEGYSKSLPRNGNHNHAKHLYLS